MKISLIQSSLAWGDVEKNLEKFGEKILNSNSSDMIVLPEMFTCGSIMVKGDREKNFAGIRTVASQYEKIKQTMLQWAQSSNSVIIGSTVCEDCGCFYNRAIVAFPDGNSLYYDKRHCFSMAGEDEYFAEGKKRLAFDFRGVKIAVFICYDLRFPVWSRNIEEYGLAVYIANWPRSRREAWNTLLKARAIENQCFVVGVNCVGKDNNDILYAGNSVIVNARGQIISAANEYEEIVLHSVLDISDLYLFRKKFTVLDDRDEFKISLD